MRAICGEVMHPPHVLLAMSLVAVILVGSPDDREDHAEG